MNPVEAPRSGGRTGLVGREDEQRRLLAFLRAADADGGALVLTGEPGSGKSSLLRLAEMSASGTTVLRATGVGAETALPFSALGQLLLPLRVALGLADGPVPSVPAVAHAVLAILRRAAATRALLLLIDDAHWLDEASAAVLAFVSRRLSGTRIGLLVATRPYQGGTFASCGLPRLPLAPLDHVAAATLLRARFPALHPMVRTTVLDLARGNPLALLELPPVLGEGSRGIGEPIPLPARLHEAFAADIPSSPRTRRAVLLSALDTEGDLRAVRAALGPAAHDDLAAAERAGLIDVDEHRGVVTFRHPLTRSAVVGAASPEQRRAAHRALARATRDRLERRAWHLGLAAVGPDGPVAALLEQAAQRHLGRGETGRAADALVRAGRLSPVRADRGRRLAKAAWLNADQTGQAEWGRTLLAEARQAGPDAAGRLYAAATAATLLVLDEGDVAVAHRMLLGEIDAAAPGAGALATTHALGVLGELSRLCGGPEPWGAYRDRLTRYPLASPQDGVLAEPAPDRLDSAVAALCEHDADPLLVMRLCPAAGDFDRTGPIRHLLHRIAREDASPPAARAWYFLGLEAFTAGNWDETGQHADRGLELCGRIGHPHLAWRFHHLRALVSAARGDPATTKALTDGMVTWAARRGAEGVRRKALHTRALAELGAGNHADALRYATAARQAGDPAADVPTATAAALLVVEAALQTGGTEVAAAEAGVLRAAGVAGLSPRLAFQVAGAAAMTAPDDQVEDLFERALALPGADRSPFEHGRVQLAYGRRLRRLRAGPRSRVPLTAALDTFTRLGAVPWADRARAELRAAGLGPDRPAGPATLTTQQLQIAQLAAAGLTNKQIAERLFLSARTVSGHLYRAFPKLGVTTRAGLRDALACRDRA
ncbi:AAA family ATPase [Amycolatopsis sacchari]|uniref:helix-turn-helix transcriptional regulator n=1 Tax=Amycolatopsis sacchari TaxID=115433 RepID=UPI003D725EAB